MNFLGVVSCRERVQSLAKRLSAESVSSWMKCLATIVSLPMLCASLHAQTPKLYVSQVLSGSGTVGEYNATTGAAINANFITGLSLPAKLVLSGNNLFVANNGSNTVGDSRSEKIAGHTIPNLRDGLKLQAFLKKQRRSKARRAAL